MGDKVMKMKPKTRNELIAGLIRVWHHELAEDLLQKLVESMPRRCAAVIKARGGATKY